jgi:hypothetical protein
MVQVLLLWARSRWEAARCDQNGMTTETVVGVSYHILT